MNRLLLHILFYVLAATLLLAAHYLPGFIQNNPPLQATVPAGISLEAAPPRWSAQSWWNGQYSTQLTTYLRDEPYLRPLSIRLKNEVQFRLFHRNANPVIEFGENGFLFDKTYINAWLGKYYAGDEAIGSRCAEIATLQTRLAQNGTRLLVLLPPPKAYVYPDQVPASYRRLSPTLNNRKALADGLRQQGVSVMDGNFFAAIAPAAPGLLYPKTGLHWSHYGAFVVVDSLRERLASLLGQPLPRMVLDSLQRTNRLRPPDNEFGEIMNLFSPYPYDSLVYPRYHIEEDSLTRRPKVLVIGDSYYHLLFEAGYQAQLFDPASRYWHYFEREYSVRQPGGKAIDKDPQAIRAVVSQMDVVIIEAGSTNLRRLGFGFAAQYESAKGE